MSGPSLRAVIGLTAGLCFVAFGYGQGDIGGLLIIKSFDKEFPSFVVPMTAGAVVGTWNLGCLVGAALLIFLSNTLGRKGSIVCGLVLEIAGRVVQAATFGPWQYIAGRFVAGLGNGFIASAVPAWHVECLKTHRRGSMLMVSFGVCVTVGIALAFCKSSTRSKCLLPLLNR
jgi:MFS family permease